MDGIGICASLLVHGYIVVCIRVVASKVYNSDFFFLHANSISHCQPRKRNKLLKQCRVKSTKETKEINPKYMHSKIYKKFPSI